MPKTEKEIIHDGVCVARMTLSLPELQKSEMEEFYREIGQKCTEWFESRVAGAAIEEYEGSDDERKRWRWRPTVFRINSSVSANDNLNEKMTLTLDVTLSRQGRIIRRIKRTHVWNTRLFRLVKTR